MSWIFSYDLKMCFNTTKGSRTVNLFLKHILDQIMILHLYTEWEEQQEACMSHRTKTLDVIPKGGWWPCVWVCKNWIGGIGSLFSKAIVVRVKLYCFSLRQLCNWITQLLPFYYLSTLLWCIQLEATPCQAEYKYRESNELIWCQHLEQNLKFSVYCRVL